MGKFVFLFWVASLLIQDSYMDASTSTLVLSGGAVNPKTKLIHILYR